MAEEPVIEPAGEALGEGGLKALNAERDARKEAERQIRELNEQLEQLKPAAEKFKELEDKQKTELDRATERLAELEAKATKAETEAMRYRIATRHGISDEDAEVFLTGSDEESITKQAERLVALQGEKVVAQQQKPDPSQGARPSMPKDAWSRGSARAKARFGPGN